MVIVTRLWYKWKGTEHIVRASGTRFPDFADAKHGWQLEMDAECMWLDNTSYREAESSIPRGWNYVKLSLSVLSSLIIILAARDEVVGSELRGSIEVVMVTRVLVKRLAAAPHGKLSCQSCMYTHVIRCSDQFWWHLYLFVFHCVGMRILVTLLLDTLPMLGNVLLLCFFVFFIFGIVGVQLWAGLLRNRCFLGEDIRT